MRKYVKWKVFSLKTTAFIHPEPFLSESSCHFVNLLSFTKSSHNSVYCLCQTQNSNLSQVSESVNFIEKVSPYLARPEVEMDPKRVFSTQHWLHTCRLPKVKFFIKRVIGVIPNRYVGISFIHIWALFAHRIVFSSRTSKQQGQILPKKSEWCHCKKCICYFFRDITNDSFHQKI